MLNSVIQEETTGCGIASVANILGKTYLEMKGGLWTSTWRYSSGSCVLVHEKARSTTARACSNAAPALPS